jgi:hypothetical protein
MAAARVPNVFGKGCKITKKRIQTDGQKMLAHLPSTQNKQLRKRLSVEA